MPIHTITIVIKTLVTVIDMAIIVLIGIQEEVIVVVGIGKILLP